MPLAPAQLLAPAQPLAPAGCGAVQRAAARVVSSPSCPAAALRSRAASAGGGRRGGCAPGKPLGEAEGRPNRRGRNSAGGGPAGSGGLGVEGGRLGTQFWIKSTNSCPLEAPRRGEADHWLLPSLADLATPGSSSKSGSGFKVTGRAVAIQGLNTSVDPTRTCLLPDPLRDSPEPGCHGDWEAPVGSPLNPSSSFATAHLFHLMFPCSFIAGHFKQPKRT